ARPTLAFRGRAAACPPSGPCVRTHNGALEPPRPVGGARAGLLSAPLPVRGPASRADDGRRRRRPPRRSRCRRAPAAERALLLLRRADRARALSARLAALPRLPRELRRDPGEGQRDVDADGGRVLPEDLARPQSG